MKSSAAEAGINFGWFALGVLTLGISHVTGDYRANLIGLVIIWTFYKITVDFVQGVLYLRSLDRPKPPPIPKRESRTSSYPPNHW